MAKDIFHYNARKALESDGWHITHDPFRLGEGEARMEVDMAGEKFFAADRENEKIVVEVKSFVSKSPMFDFHLAVGQYSNYRSALRYEGHERVFYLAISETVFYSSFFQTPFIQKRLKEEDMKLIIFQPDNNKIIEWIN